MDGTFAGISPGAHGEARASGSEPAESEKGRLMSTKESNGGKPSVTIREEQTRNQPLLDATVSEQDGQLEVFVEPDWMLNGTEPGEWYQTRAFIEFDSLEELA